MELYTCTKCKKEKSSSEFYKRKDRTIKSVSSSCKECIKERTSATAKTLNGVISGIYSHQKQSKEFKIPTYTKTEFESWCLNNKTFTRLYDLWVAAGYIKDKKPTIDRLDNSKGYSFDNIRVVTWFENRNREYKDMQLGTSNKCKGVMKYTVNNVFIEKYGSIKIAAKSNNMTAEYISECCRGKRKIYKGFIWRFMDG